MGYGYYNCMNVIYKCACVCLLEFWLRLWGHYTRNHTFFPIGLSFVSLSARRKLFESRKIACYRLINFSIYLGPYLIPIRSVPIARIVVTATVVALLVCMVFVFFSLCGLVLGMLWLCFVLCVLLLLFYDFFADFFWRICFVCLCPMCFARLRLENRCS